jgi:2-desacetyl-2-hydroxyethyl bacteriochlorophyllide A dehydrogenase
MRAAVLHAFGGPETLCFEEVPDPVPGPGEVLLRVRACAVNRTLDLELMENGAGWPLTFPHIPGSEPAGEVVALGPGVRSVRVGDRVAALPASHCGECRYCLLGRSNLCEYPQGLGRNRPGGYAELVAVPARSLIPIPPSLSYAEGAAIPQSFTTAWHLLVTRAQVRPEDTVLVLGAAGALGIAGVQIAKLHGARVIAVAGSEEKLRRVRELGADETINHRTHDFAAEARRLTGGRGVDVVYENVGAATWDQSIAALAQGGRLVTCGTHGGADARLDLRYFYRTNLVLMGSAGATDADVVRVREHLWSGRLRPVVYATFPLERIAEAAACIRNRENIGKVVVTID